MIYPLTRIDAISSLRPSLIGAVNGRFLNIKSDAASLSSQTSFVQFEEGIRLKPSVFDDRLRLNYLVDFQQFAAGEDSHASFHRWTLDLKHEVPLYRTVSSTGPKDTNGPDECFQSVGSKGCPPVSYSRNREGSVNFRLLSTRSAGNAGSQVPFYFQPTLGGSDINGQRLLSAYDDYQFRGPNLFALQESVEHSIWGPIGAYLLLEQGKITAEGVGFGSGELLNSVAVGLTLRAGGFPLVNLTFAWGGGSHHIIGSMDPSLLGGSSRPSLYSDGHHFSRGPSAPRSLSASEPNPSDEAALSRSLYSRTSSASCASWIALTLRRMRRPAGSTSRTATSTSAPTGNAFATSPSRATPVSLIGMRPVRPGARKTNTPNFS